MAKYLNAKSRVNSESLQNLLDLQVTTLRLVSLKKIMLYVHRFAFDRCTLSMSVDIHNAHGVALFE